MMTWHTHHGPPTNTATPFAFWSLYKNPFCPLMISVSISSNLAVFETLFLLPINYHFLTTCFVIILSMEELRGNLVVEMTLGANTTSLEGSKKRWSSRIRLRRFLKEQRGRLYIVRRCV